MFFCYPYLATWNINWFKTLFVWIINEINDSWMVVIIHATICRQYYWEQHIGPLLAKIPIILLLLLLLEFKIFLFHYLLYFCYCWSSKSEILCCSKLTFAIVLVLYFCTLKFIKRTFHFKYLNINKILLKGFINLAFNDFLRDISNKYLLGIVNLLVWYCFWLILVTNKPSFVWYCFCILVQVDYCLVAFGL